MRFYFVGLCDMDLGSCDVGERFGSATAQPVSGGTDKLWFEFKKLMCTLYSLIIQIYF